MNQVSFNPIGFVKTERKEKSDHHWGEVSSTIVLDEDLSDGLTGLAGFSHILVVYHLNEAAFIRERHLVRRPQGREDMPNVGIFSQRAKDRPNPIGITAAKLISVQHNEIFVQGLDAIDGTPVLDIKPYYPQYDLKADATVPEWVDRLMKGLFLTNALTQRFDQILIANAQGRAASGAGLLFLFVLLKLKIRGRCSPASQNRL